MTQQVLKGFGESHRNGVRRRVLASTSLAAAGFLAAWAPGVALAQPDDPEASEAQTVQEVVVTGSRIVRRDLIANSPIATVTAATLENNSSAQLETKLAQMPQFTGAPSQFATGGVNSTQQALINMRGLGSNRNLVLLDGRRLQPSTSALTIDINTIPSALIESVEVITGGASAVYGSDAVSGVVNFKLKQQFSGVQLDAQYGVSERGDAQTKDVSLAAGGNFADDRGNAMFALNYYNRGAMEAYDRAFYRNGAYNGGGPSSSNTLPTGTFNPDSANLPNAAVINAVFRRYGVTSNVTASTVLGFNTDGTLFTDTNGVRNYKGPGPEAGFATTASGTLVFDPAAMSKIMDPLTRYSGFARLSYDLSDHVQVYGQAMITNYTSYADGTGTQAVGVGQYALSVPVTNPFIPADLRTILASRPNPNANFSVFKRFNQLGRREYELKTDLSQLIVGAKGDLPVKDWTWDIYGSHGEASFTQIYSKGHAYLSLMQRLLMAPDGGASLCTGGFNVFGDVPISPSCAAFVGRTATNRTTLSQDVLEGTVQGGLIDLPAGTARFAGGINYRQNTYSFVPDQVLLTTPPDLLAVNSAAPTHGSTRVTEGYLELSIPVLRDLPFIKSFEIDPAFRYSHYNIIGGVKTYKVDANWQVTSDFRFRGGYQRAVRAPNIGELFTGALYPQNTIPSVTAGGGDPCDVRSVYRTNAATAAQVRALCLAQGVPTSAIDIYTSNFNQFTGVTRGSTALEPEVADTLTLGAVWRPRFESPWLKSLSVSVDYFRVKLDKAIGTIPGSTSLYNCFNANNTNPTFSPTNFYCANVTRTADGTINLVSQAYMNLGGYRTSGIDMQVNWGVDLAEVGLGDSAGQLSVGVAATYLRSFRIQNLPDSPFLNYTGTVSSAGTPYPRWKANTVISYQQGPVGVGFKWHYLSAMKDVTTVTNPTRVQPGTPAYNTFDIYGSVKITSKVEVRGGVDNLTDKAPYIVGGIPASTDPNTFDPIGRRYYLAVRAKF